MSRDNARMVAMYALAGLAMVIAGAFVAAAKQAGWFVAIARTFAALQGAAA
jgi:hypothetical protein